MNPSRIAHDKAMDLAFRADRAKAGGDSAGAAALYRKALEQEELAIRELRSVQQPSHAVLHRSAAWLALDCDNPATAERLAAAGLAAEPPSHVADELRTVFEQANFHRHLQLRGVTLSGRQLQISLTGPSVGVGLAPWPRAKKYVDDSIRLLQRIVERKANLPFRERGPIRKDVRDLVMPLVSVPRPASYAVTITFGTTEQITHPAFGGLPEIEAVLDDFLDILDIVDHGEQEKLESVIPEIPYRVNALTLARELAPDGKDVTQVGFTLRRNDKDRRVGLTTHRSDIAIPTKVESFDVGEALVSVTGVLRHADALGKTNSIKVVSDDGKAHTVSVPPELMDDIVRPKWNCRVTVTGTRRGKSIYLSEIVENDE